MYICTYRDISALARAAVSGDESALDMFNWKKGGTGRLPGGAFGAPAEALGFYVGTEGGKLFTHIFSLFLISIIMSSFYIQLIGLKIMLHINLLF